MKSTLSIVIIAQDEADRISAAIESAGFADEILVVDGGSLDGTAALAEALGARVLSNPWPGYGAQRTFGAAQARGDWILALDADERIDAHLAASIVAFVGAPGDNLGATLPRRLVAWGAPLRFGGFGAQSVLRLCRRGAGRWVGGPVHERLEVDGLVVPLEGFLLHESYRDLGDHLRRIDRYTVLQADTPSRWPASLDLLFSPSLFFLKRYVLRLGFLDGWRGLLMAGMGAFSRFLRAARRWERTLAVEEGPSVTTNDIESPREVA